MLGALPQQPQLLRAKLEETRRELAVLEDRRRHIERSVARWGSVGGAQERWRGNPGLALGTSLALETQRIVVLAWVMEPRPWHQYDDVAPACP